jgi:hypothetical protein
LIRIKKPFLKPAKILSTFLLLFFLFTSVQSQQFVWRAGFNGFFDNREYFNPYSHDQTMFGARTFGQIGLKFDEHNEFNVGINFLYEFGSSLNSKYLQPILYYHYQTEPVKLYIGSFERRKLIDLPLVLQSDTFQYYSPNLLGIFVEAKKDWGYQNVWIDWVSRQGVTDKEIFLIGGTGFLKKGVLFYRHDFIMTHLAKTKTDAESEHIHDNGGFCAGIGINLSHKTFLDSLSLSTGLTMSYDRIRNVYSLEYYKGSLTEFCAQYKAFGIHSIVYLGDGQVQLEGDALYKAKSYERVDFFLKLFRKGPVKAKVTFSLHFIESKLNYSQAFTVYMDMGGAKNIKSITNYSDL